MTQRRKAVTYGKSSRKPTSDFSAFAPASEMVFEPVYREIITATATTQDSTIKLAQRPANSKPLPEARKAASKMEGPTSSGHASIQNQDVQDDFSSIDDEIDRTASTPDDKYRKKRKLTPKDEDPLTSPVFDDDSLQRHIAAEVQRDSTIVSSVGSELFEKSKSPLIHARGVSRASEHNKKFPVKNCPSTSMKPSGSDTTYPPKSHKLKASSTNKPVWSKIQDSNVSTSKNPPRKTEENKRTFAKPARDDLQRSLPIRDQSETKTFKSKHNFPPSTPPRPRGSGIRAITPKRKELWGMLLSNDKQKANPSGLDLPSLRISDQQVQSRKPNIMPYVQMERRAVNVEVGKRSARLVDFLTASDRDRSVCAHGLSEEDESSGTEQPRSSRSEVSISDDVLTMQTSPSAGSQSKRPQSLKPGLAPISQPISSLQTAPKLTYIRERTHLGDNGIANAIMLDIPVPELEFYRERPRGLSGLTKTERETAKDIFYGLDDTQDSQGGPMKSIHELREAGGNTRLTGELEAILDDLDERLDSSISARRSSLMSLTSRLLDVSTCRMFVDQGLEPRLLAQVNFGHDIIERSLLAASILQILFFTTSAAFLSQINQVRTTNLFIGLLDHKKDLTKQAKLRETNMSKLAQSEYTTLCSSYLRLPVWRNAKPPMLSGQILALQCLNLLVRQAREAGSSVEILSADAISCIAETSLPPSGALQSVLDSAVGLELAVSVLESSTIGNAPENRDAEWTDAAVERISGVFPLLIDTPNHEYGSLRTLTLRLYLNLTNTNPHLCETFAKTHVISAIFRTMFVQFDRLSKPESQQQSQHVLDNLVLSLGCLINLAESSDTMRQLVMELKTSEGNLLETLLQLFMKKRRKAAEAISEEEAGNNVAFGYLSVLLSYLCFNKMIRSYVDARHEAPNLNGLLDAVEEFLQYHRQIDDYTNGENEGKDRRANFVSRLQGTVDDLRSSR